MASNLNPSQRAGLVAVIDPDAYAVGTLTTGWIDMQAWFAILAVLMVGDMVATATLNAKFQQAKDGSGTGAKDVSATAITALTQAGADDNKQALINLSSTDLDFNNGFRFVRLSATLAAAGADFGAVVIGLDRRFGAANEGNITAVDEVVS